ncbi:MAG TPA: class III signal peptide-containing protein [Methanobacterium sp.]|nr:class III signal peptide-containing protein [Methanobacterium sp.]
MDSRGQASAEYLFLILIFLIILATVTIPFAGNAISSSQNVSVTSDAQTALSSIVNAVNVVYANGPGAKRTVSVYFPQDSTLSFSSNVLMLGLTNIPFNASNPGTLKPNVNETVPYNVTVTGGSVAKGWHTVVITWSTGSPISVQVT